MTLCLSCHKSMTGEHANKKRHTRCAAIYSSQDRIKRDLIRGQKCLTCKKPMKGEHPSKKRHTHCTNIAIGQKRDRGALDSGRGYEAMILGYNQGTVQRDATDAWPDAVIRHRSSRQTKNQ